MSYDLSNIPSYKQMAHAPIEEQHLSEAVDLVDELGTLDAALKRLQQLKNDPTDTGQIRYSAFAVKVNRALVINAWSEQQTPKGSLKDQELLEHLVDSGAIPPSFGNLRPKNCDVPPAIALVFSYPWAMPFVHFYLIEKDRALTGADKPVICYIPNADVAVQVSGLAVTVRARGSVSDTDMLMSVCRSDDESGDLIIRLRTDLGVDEFRMDYYWFVYYLKLVYAINESKSGYRRFKSLRAGECAFSITSAGMFTSRSSGSQINMEFVRPAAQQHYAPSTAPPYSVGDTFAVNFDLSMDQSCLFDANGKFIDPTHGMFIRTFGRFGNVLPEFESHEGHFGVMRTTDSNAFIRTVQMLSSFWLSFFPSVGDALIKDDNSYESGLSATNIAADPLIFMNDCKYKRV